MKFYSEGGSAPGAGGGMPGAGGMPNMGNFGGGDSSAGGPQIDEVD